MKNKIKLFIAFFVSATFFFACSKNDDIMYPNLAVSKEKITLEEGKTETVNIVTGSENYEVSSSDKNKVIATLNGKVIKVEGIAEGTAVITVKDIKSQQMKTINVIVTAKVPDLAIEKEEVVVEVGKTVAVGITAGSGEYTAVSSNESKITILLDGGIITIKGIAEGIVMVSVKDVKTEQTKTIKVVVKPRSYNDKVFVKGGTFKMGSPDGEGGDDEHPQHQVTLNDFYIGKYEVTNALYAKFLNEKGNQIEEGTNWLKINVSYCQIEQVDGTFQPKKGKENYPVICVTWFGAKAYAEWVGGRLPTEAEWEYAARGGQESKGYKYAGSNNVDEVAWYDKNSTNPDNPMLKGRGTNIVGKAKANELGIHDMSGNVFEWCSDWYGNYSGEAVSNPQGPKNGSDRILRGGCWDTEDKTCGIVFRDYNYPNSANDVNGFRVVYEK